MVESAEWMIRKVDKCKWSEFYNFMLFRFYHYTWKGCQTYFLVCKNSHPNYVLKKNSALRSSCVLPSAADCWSKTFDRMSTNFGRMSTIFDRISTNFVRMTMLDCLTTSLTLSAVWLNDACDVEVVHCALKNNSYNLNTGHSIEIWITH